jgi:hypothetical protein
VSATVAALPESERNRRLRRVDWRFLLSAPLPGRTLCLASGELAEGVALISGEVVRSAEAGSCDLSVAEDPDRATLQILSTALRPGGACYVEWRSARVRSATRARRAMEAAGLDQVTSYWPWPAPIGTGTRCWIPLGSPGAAAHVRSRDPKEGNGPGWLADVLRHHSRDTTLALGLVQPLCTLGVRGTSAAITLSAWLRTGWAGWGLGPAPRDLSLLLLTGGPRSVSKVVALVFDEPDPSPRLAIKAPRVSESFAPLRREAAVLQALRDRPAAVAGVPRHVFSREVDGVPIVGETALVGHPLESLLSGATLRFWGIKAAEWLVGLVDAGSARPAAHWWRTIVEPALIDFAGSFGAGLDPSTLTLAESLLREIGDLPSACEQRDFAPWNVFVTADGGFAVLDWESAVVEGLPALDLIYFLAYATFNADRAERLEDRVASYRRSLDPRTVTGAVRRDSLALYGERSGLTPKQISMLGVLVWLVHARSEYQHFTADAGGTPTAVALRRSLFAALWQEEMRHASRQ